MKKILQFLSAHLFNINDTPHKIALGFAVGVFAGILPGTGPIAAVFLAMLFRANRAASLAGALATNTWLSLVIFAISLQTGAFMTGTDWRASYEQCQSLLKDFHWREFFSVQVLAVAKPLLIGYCVVGLLLALLVYGVVFVGFWLYRRRKTALSSE